MLVAWSLMSSRRGSKQLLGVCRIMCAVDLIRFVQVEMRSEVGVELRHVSRGVTSDHF